MAQADGQGSVTFSDQVRLTSGIVKLTYHKPRQPQDIVSKTTSRRTLTVQNFRKDCLRELKKIKVTWPGLKYQIEHGCRHEKTTWKVLRWRLPMTIDHRLTQTEGATQ